MLTTFTFLPRIQEDRVGYASHRLQGGAPCEDTTSSRWSCSAVSGPRPAHRKSIRCARSGRWSRRSSPSCSCGLARCTWPAGPDLIVKPVLQPPIFGFFPRRSRLNGQRPKGGIGIMGNHPTHFICLKGEYVPWKRKLLSQKCQGSGSPTQPW